MAYYITDRLDQKIRVDIVCDSDTDIDTLPTQFCPGSTATVVGDDAKIYILSASYEWKPKPNTSGGGGGRSDKGLPAFTTKLQDYAYKFDYPTLDYAGAYKHFAEEQNAPTNACSTLRNGNFVGRQLDWLYSNMADVVVRTPHTAQYKKVIGTAGGMSNITEAYIQAHSTSEKYKLIPFYLQDGINEDGLFACMNVVPTDYGVNTAIPTGTQEVEINALMLVRFVLDRFSTASEAANYIKEHCKVFFPVELHQDNYETHIFLTSGNTSYAVEFINNATEIVDISATPYMTNFHRYGVTLNADNTVMTPATGDAIEVNGITEYGQGLERFNIIASGIDGVTDKAKMRVLLDELTYTRMYSTNPDYANPEWLTELVGGDLKVNSAVSAFADATSAAGQAYTDRDRNNPKTWQTTHSVIYDLANKTMSICFQEDSAEYTFDIDGNKFPQGQE